MVEHRPASRPFPPSVLARPQCRRLYGDAARSRRACRHARRRWAERSGLPAGHARQAGGSGSGLVAGQRLGRKDTWSKRWASKIANAVRGWFLGDGTRDTGCGLKAFRRDAYLDLPYFETMHRFLPALFIADGWKVELVDVVDRPRWHGTRNTEISSGCSSVFPISSASPGCAGAAGAIRWRCSRKGGQDGRRNSEAHSRASPSTPRRSAAGCGTCRAGRRRGAPPRS